jgi:hypothetical protein
LTISKRWSIGRAAAFRFSLSERLGSANRKTFRDESYERFDATKRCDNVDTPLGAHFGLKQQKTIAFAPLLLESSKSEQACFHRQAPILKQRGHRVPLNRAIGQDR